ncbi:MAG: TldD/PmbA family protein [Prevotellaceae bacterium]|jgi:predicted Zn-dependent protease|nr:TldD/PmbA family protein [Prevotellaceae bacterium]
MIKKRLLLTMLLFAVFATMAFSRDNDKLVDILKNEINRNFAVLKEQPVPAYYIACRAQDVRGYEILTSFGSTIYSIPFGRRMYNLDVRVGDYVMDNTKELKDSPNGRSQSSRGLSMVQDDNEQALRSELWRITDETYKNAVKQFENVKANVAVKVASEDKSNDFSQELRETYIEPPLKQLKDIGFNPEEWSGKMKKYSGVFSSNKNIYDSRAQMSVELTRRYFVDTEGAEIAENKYVFRINITASTTADDGMSLPLYKSYFASDIKDLPSDEQIMADVAELSHMISALRKAPVAETYTGPALMTAEAAGVFFHEIFGHRVEGARLKQENDAQTFKKKIGEQVLPTDISVIFDPALKKYKGIPLNGSYIFDDEGVRGQKVEVVKNGILKSFLMSRTPIDGFPKSNGHGRAVIQLSNVTRQSNMIIESKAPKTIKQMRAMLVDQIKAENKDYGYLFDKVSGGFTTTGRYMPNAFNVAPLIVYRIYADGRPDELVRGVDLIGTPLSIFSQVSACGDDHGTFNGMCGAESGSIPVACVSPTLFIKTIETQRKSKSQNQPPILDRPTRIVKNTSETK